jgi:N-acetyl-anhydromuramyl-L-alanine amidase AmpD
MNITNIISRLSRNGVQDTAHSLGQITHIIVHHDAQNRSNNYDSVTRYQQQANYHIGRGEDGLQYHFKIDNVGEVFQCRNLTDTLWHCSNYAVNRASIAICLDGNFTQQIPTREQYTALKNLLDWLSTQHPEFPADQNDVYYHNEVALAGYKTACCGWKFWDWVTSYRNNKGNVAIPNVPFNDGSTSEPVNPVQAPPVGPIVEDIYRVYDSNGVQVGAYKVLANAQTKLDSLEAGVIRDKNGSAIQTKTKPSIISDPPFIGTPGTPVIEVPTVETPIETPSTEIPQTEVKPDDPTVAEPEKTPMSHNVISVIWEFLKTIADFINKFRKGGK